MSDQKFSPRTEETYKLKTNQSDSSFYGSVSQSGHEESYSLSDGDRESSNRSFDSLNPNSPQPVPQPSTPIFPPKDAKKSVTYYSDVTDQQGKSENVKSGGPTPQECVLNIPKRLNFYAPVPEGAVVRLWVVVIVTLGLCVALFIAAHLTHSLSVRVEAYHSLYNLFTLSGSLLSIKVMYCNT